MAKELPYFKFEPSEWDNGNIQMCSRESKGLFIDLCSLYWSRLGELPHALALQKLCNGNKDALQELLQHEIFGIIDGQIVIEFLDEQLSERGQISEKRRESAQKRWKDANALQTESKSNAKRREEKREEEKRKEESPAIERNFDWFKKQIDEVWTDQLPSDKKNKLGAAIENAWAFLSTDSHRLKIIDSSGCKKLVNNAFEFIKVGVNGKGSKILHELK